MKFFSFLPSWETFLLYIGGIPTIITSTCISIMIAIAAKHNAFSFKDLKHIRKSNKQLLNEEKMLRIKILKAPRGVRFIYRKMIGEINYHDFITGG